MKLLLSLFSLLLHLYSYSQHWGSNTTSQFTNEFLDVESDANGNLYVAGYITGETSFDAAVAETFVSGNGDAILAKYNAQGNLLWIKRFGGTGSDRAIDLAIGPDQNPVVAGQFFNTMAINSISINSSGQRDIFVAKFDPAGNTVWAIAQGGAGDENAYSISVDGSGNVILAGQFKGSTTLAGNTFVSTINPTTGNSEFDLFVAKFNSAGTPLWSLAGSAPYEDRATAVTTDNSNNIYLAGQFSKTLSFAGSTVANNAYNIGFVTKLSPAGAVLYFNKLTGGFILPQDIKKGAGNTVFVAGDFGGNLHYNDGSDHVLNTPYSSNVFLLKTDLNGSYQAANKIGSENYLSCQALAVNSSNTAYITGFFTCSLTQLRDSAHTAWNSAGYKDPFLFEFSPGDSLTKPQQYGGQKDDIGHGLTLTSSGTPVFCGSYTRPLYFTSSAASVTVGAGDFHLQPDANANMAKLHGDDSPNGFLSSYYVEDMQDYDFFTMPSDSLHGQILSSNSIHCTKDSLLYEAFTFHGAGPLYNYLWNTGSTNRSILPLTPGNYSVHVSRADGCVSDFDNTIVYQTPGVFISDDYVLYTNDTLDGQQYHICPQDSLHTWFTGIYADSISISYPGGAYNDFGPHSYNYTGNHIVTVSNEHCFATGHFEVSVTPTFAPEDMDPVIVIPALVNDTVTMCSNVPVHFWLLDSLTNPALQTGVFYPQHIANIIAYAGCVSNNLTTINHFEGIFSVPSSGWYTLEFDVSTGSLNDCIVDTQTFHVVKHFYVVVKPAPTFNTTLSADGLLCPNGSVYLFTSATNPSLSWSGPGVDWTSTSGDTAQVTAAGLYHYAGTLTDSVNGCSDTVNFTFELHQKVAPAITAATNILCPYDSVMMSVPDIYFAYEWISPSGDDIGTAHFIYGSELGSYYCHVIDTEGCNLTSLPFTLNEYSTPFLTVSPQNILCAGQSATIQVNCSSIASISWINPIGLTVPGITTDTAGIFICSVSGCGTTATDTIEIFDRSFSVSLLANDTTLCGGDTLLIQASDYTYDYTWNNGSAGPELPVSQSGSYSATATNEYGCTASTQTVNISVVQGSEIPSVDNIEICSGSPATFTDTANTIVSWYDIDSTLITQGTVFSAGSFASDTSFLVSHQGGSCPATFAEIMVTVIDSLPQIIVPEDIFICPDGETEITASPDSLDFSWSVYGTTISGPEITLEGPEADTSQPIILTAWNSCFSETYAVAVHFPVFDTIAFGPDSLRFCLDQTIVLEAEHTVSSLTWQSVFGSYNGQQYTYPDVSGGNWIYLTGTDSNNCAVVPDSVFVESITMNYNLQASQTAYCPGSLFQIDLSTSADSLTWIHNNVPLHFTDSVFTLDNASSGSWYLFQFDTNGCQFRDTAVFIVAATPVFQVPEDSMICLSDLGNLSLPYQSENWTWIIGNPFTDTTYFGSQLVVVTTISDTGCVFADTLIAVNCSDSPPNVFTPNGDGANDFFEIDDALMNPQNELIILNRWGNVVFRESGYKNTFNGAGMPDGTYFYIYHQDKTQPGAPKFNGFFEIFR